MFENLFSSVNNFPCYDIRDKISSRISKIDQLFFKLYFVILLRICPKRLFLLFSENHINDMETKNPIMYQNYTV